MAPLPIMLYFRGQQSKSKPLSTTNPADSVPSRNPLLPESASYESLLLHPVPSSRLSFAFDTIFDPSTSNQTSWLGATNSPGMESASQDQRDSLATLVEFGDWIQEQSKIRCSRLLPPTPQPLQQSLANLEPGSVDCRLSAEADHNEAPFDPTADNLTGSFRPCASFESSRSSQAHPSDSETSSRFPSRAETPSLTHSQCSTSVSSAESYSPHTIFFVPVPSPSSDQHQLSRVSEQKPRPPFLKIRRERSNTDPLIRNISSPLPSPLLPQNEGSSQPPSRSVNSFCFDEDRYQPSRPVPTPQSMTGTSTVQHSPTSPAGNEHPEVSFIEWDDDDETFLRQTQNRLIKMKKSFSDLRAAERSFKNAVKKKEARAKAEQEAAQQSAPAVPSGEVDLVPVRIDYMQETSPITGLRRPSAPTSASGGLTYPPDWANSSTLTIVPASGTINTAVQSTLPLRRPNRQPYLRSYSEPQNLAHVSTPSHHLAVTSPPTTTATTEGQSLSVATTGRRRRRTGSSVLICASAIETDPAATSTADSQPNSAEFKAARKAVSRELKRPKVAPRKSSTVSLTESIAESQKAKVMGVGRWMKRVMSGTKAEYFKDSDLRSLDGICLGDEVDLDREEDLIAFLRGFPPPATQN